MKILIPTLRFPPGGGVGLRRIIKVAKEISNCGAEIHFITTENKNQVNNYGHDLKGNITVNKIPSLSLNNYFNKIITSVIGRIIRRFVYYLTSPLFFVDHGFLWGIVLVPYMLMYIKKHEIANIYCSGAPFSTLWQSAVVKRLFGKKVNLICEWRDLWVNDYEREFFPPPKCLNKYIQGRMETFVIKQCDKGIVVTRGLLDVIPEEYREKFVVIENGYDEAEFPETVFEKYKNNNMKSIVYAGNVVDEGRFEGLKVFLKAFREVVKIDVDFKFEFCGQVSYAIERFILREYGDLVEAGNINLYGVVSTQDAINLTSNAGFGLVLVQRRHIEALTSKFFEYCASGKKIIAIGPCGELREKMRAYGIEGYFCLDNPSAITDMVRYIEFEYNKPINEDGFKRIRKDNKFSSIAREITRLFV